MGVIDKFIYINPYDNNYRKNIMYPKKILFRRLFKNRILWSLSNNLGSRPHLIVYLDRLKHNKVNLLFFLLANDFISILCTYKFL